MREGEAFVHLADQRSFTRAARILYRGSISRGPISHAADQLGVLRGRFRRGEHRARYIDAGVRVSNVPHVRWKMHTASPDSTTARHSRTVVTTGPLAIGRPEGGKVGEMTAAHAPN